MTDRPYPIDERTRTAAALRSPSGVGHTDDEIMEHYRKCGPGSRWTGDPLPWAQLTERVAEARLARVWREIEYLAWVGGNASQMGRTADMAVREVAIERLLHEQVEPLTEALIEAQQARRGAEDMRRPT